MTVPPTPEVVAVSELLYELFDTAELEFEKAEEVIRFVRALPDMGYRRARGAVTLHEPAEVIIRRGR